jgi:hypothetical protein
MGLLLSNYKHVETKIEWNHGANSNQLYRLEGSLTGGEASPADRCTVLQDILDAFSGHVTHLIARKDGVP